MIDKDNGMYTLICDICGEEHYEAFFDFYDAVEVKKDIGWRSMKIGGEWSDVCDKCARKLKTRG